MRRLVRTRYSLKKKRLAGYKECLKCPIARTEREMKEGVAGSDLKTNLEKKGKSTSGIPETTGGRGTQYEWSDGRDPELKKT